MLGVEALASGEIEAATELAGFLRTRAEGDVTVAHVAAVALAGHFLLS